MVQSPSHYKKQFECIDAMLDCYGVVPVAHFCKLNAFKYLWRSDRKENDIQDMKKAQWYINKYLELMEK